MGHTNEVNREFWFHAWAEHRIGFHRQDVHPDLIHYFDKSIAGGERILVPLCGKSHDMPHLVARGIEVVGVELVQQAVDEFHAEHGLEPEVSQEGEFRVHRSKGLSIYCGDIFALEPDLVGRFDRIWDRAALVAVDPAERARYARQLMRLAGPGARLLQNAVEYDQAVMSGPPWSVPRAEVLGLYGEAVVEELHRQEAIDEVPGRRERGHRSWIHTCYQIELQ